MPSYDESSQPPADFAPHIEEVDPLLLAAVAGTAADTSRVHDKDWVDERRSENERYRDDRTGDGLSTTRIDQALNPSRLFDPRVPAADCNCQTEDHSGVLEIIDDSRRVIGRMMVAHTPFPLIPRHDSRDGIDGFDISKEASWNRRTAAAQRLCVALFNVPGIETMRYAKYSAVLVVSKAFPEKPMVNTLEAALRHAGCPQFKFSSVDSEIGFKVNSEPQA